MEDKIEDRIGLILAGGKATRLYPATLEVSKQLLPVYDKPMIYYPLSVLMLAGIKKIGIISTPQDLPKFERLLKDGSQLGMNFKYIVQEKPEGLPQAFTLEKSIELIGDSRTCLILGDNLIYGHGLTEKLKQACNRKEGATIFAYQVNNPQDYGVVEFDEDFTILSIEEKPEKPRSNYAVIGLYFYDNNVIEHAKSLKKSERNEFEIVDLHKKYLGNLKVEVLEEGFAWLDTGNEEALAEASEYIRVLQKRQGLRIACIEEIAYNQGWINKEQLEKLAEPLMKSGYGKHLLSLLKK